MKSVPTGGRGTCRRALAVVALAVLVTAGCGTRVPSSERQAAASSQDEVLLEEELQVDDPAGSEDAASGPDGVSGTGGAVAGPGRTNSGSAGPGRQAGPTTTVQRRADGTCTEKKPQVVIGSVGWYSGLSNPNGTKAIQAWVATVNARGGVNCHEVKYLVADDGADPARHQQLVQKMVEQDKVVAFVNTYALSQTTYDYLNRQRIPVVGGPTADSFKGGNYYYESPTWFPTSQHGDSLYAATFYAVGDFGRLAGKTKLGVLTCAEVAACTIVRQRAEEYAPKIGMTLVYNGQASLAQPDYTAQCQAAQNAGAEVLFVAMDASSVTRLARSCAGVTYRPQFVSLNSSPSMLSDPNLDGFGIANPVIPWFLEANPGVAEFREALKRHAPGVEPEPITIQGWVAAKYFERATQQLRAPTSEAVLDGLWTIKEHDLGGLSAPYTFTKDTPTTPRICWWLGRIRDGKWTTPNEGKRNCA